MHGVLALIMAMFLAGQAAAGTWTSNQFIYKPALGAKGETEKNIFDTGLDRVDAHLGNYRTLGDPNYGTLSEALATIGSTAIALVIPAGTVNITGNTTIPANVHLKVLRGGTFNISTGVTLTINGPFEAGPYQVFSWTGTGKAAFGDGAVREVYPEWWGAKADGSTNSAAAIQAAANACPRVTFGRGHYIINNATIYLNSTNRFDNYLIRGQGLKTKITMTGFAAATYTFKLNEDAGGAKVVSYPAYPRLTLQDLWFTADGSSTPDFMRVRECSVIVERVRFDGFRHGFFHQDYSDNNRFQNVIWAYGAADGYLYYQNSLGDGTVLDQVHAFNTPVLHDKGLARFHNASNARISNCIGGRLLFVYSRQMVIDNFYVEGAGSTPIEIRASDVTVRNSILWNNMGYHPVIVDDFSSASHRSHVLLDTLVSRSTFHSAGLIRSDDVRINNPVKGTVVKLRNCRAELRDNSSWTFNTLGITASSSDAALNAVLANSRHLLSADAQISMAMADEWQVTPMGVGAMRLWFVHNPMFDSTAVNTTYPSNLPAATYYYTAAVHFGPGLHTAKGNEAVRAVSANQAVELTLRARSSYGTLRVWRGTASGSYNRYVDIPLSAYEPKNLYDMGDHISGFPWITTGVPTPWAVNTTNEGFETAFGLRTMWSGAAPSSSEYTAKRGDVVWNTNATAGQPPGWVCTAAGSPGTWKAMANLAN